MKPLKFQPLLKSTIWGGSKIIAFKHLDVKQEKVGESWEISGVPGKESIVADGEMQGKSLNEVVKELKGSFLGEENYKRFGNEFPLLIKFIDANNDLSIQVHPNDEIAHKQGKKHGKTEMWYALPSEPDAKLYNGLKMQITPEQYKEMVENDTITDALAQYDVKEGDCFFIPAGRIHAIGTGCFVTEIQQTSDVTYRIYDYKRKDKDGNYRQLHTKEAAECIDYNVQADLWLAARGRPQRVFRPGQHDPRAGSRTGRFKARRCAERRFIQRPCDRRHRKAGGADMAKIAAPCRLYRAGVRFCQLGRHCTPALPCV